MTGRGLVLVTWTGSMVVLPTGSEPKSREAGVRVSGEGAAVLMRLMNSSEVAESEAISRAATWVPGVWGLLATEMVQVAPGQWWRRWSGRRSRGCGEAEDVQGDGAGVGEDDGLGGGRVADSGGGEGE